MEIYIPQNILTKFFFQLYYSLLPDFGVYTNQCYQNLILCYPSNDLALIKLFVLINDKIYKLFWILIKQNLKKVHLCVRKSISTMKNKWSSDIFSAFNCCCKLLLSSIVVVENLGKLFAITFTLEFPIQKENLQYFYYTK